MIFLQKLDKFEILNLINQVKEQEQRRGNFFMPVESADDFDIFQKESDENEYVWYRALTRMNSLLCPSGVFRFSDFTLDLGEPCEEYNEMLREVMTRRFGDDYLICLENYLHSIDDQTPTGR